MNAGTSQSQQPEQIKAVRVQTSTYGAVRQLVYGTTRITGNMIWFGDFTAQGVYSDTGSK